MYRISFALMFCFLLVNCDEKKSEEGHCLKNDIECGNKDNKASETKTGTVVSFQKD